MRGTLPVRRRGRHLERRQGAFHGLSLSPSAAGVPVSGGCLCGDYFPGRRPLLSGREGSMAYGSECGRGWAHVTTVVEMAVLGLQLPSDVLVGSFFPSLATFKHHRDFFFLSQTFVALFSEAWGDRQGILGRRVVADGYGSGAEDPPTASHVVR
jgi:hypothetical protein